MAKRCLNGHKLLNKALIIIYLSFLDGLATFSHVWP